jgi:hypothetical protein
MKEAWQDSVALDIEPEFWYYCTQPTVGMTEAWSNFTLTYVIDPYTGLMNQF